VASRYQTTYSNRLDLDQSESECWCIGCPTSFSVPGYKNLGGDVYAFEFVGRHHSHHMAMLRNLRYWIGSNLEIIDDGRTPSMVDRYHLETLLEYTVLRHVKHTRGRLLTCVDPTSAVNVGKGLAAAEAACARLLVAFNGDVRLGYPVHIKTQETKNMTRDQIVDFCCEACLEARLIPGASSCLPSENKWGTVMHSLQRQGAGFISRKLERQLNRSGIPWGAPQ
jgi:hypothetical protein